MDGAVGEIKLTSPLSYDVDDLVAQIKTTLALRHEIRDPRQQYNILNKACSCLRELEGNDGFASLHRRHLPFLLQSARMIKAAAAAEARNIIWTSGPLTGPDRITGSDRAHLWECMKLRRDAINTLRTLEEAATPSAARIEACKRLQRQRGRAAWKKYAPAASLAPRPTRDQDLFLRAYLG